MSFEKAAFRQGFDNEEQILRNVNAIRYRSSTPPVDGSERFRSGHSPTLGT